MTSRDFPIKLWQSISVTCGCSNKTHNEETQTKNSLKSNNRGTGDNREQHNHINWNETEPWKKETNNKGL